MSLELAETPANSIPVAVAMPVRQRVPNRGSFVPGKSGNPSGRPRSAFFRKEAIKQLKMEIAPGTTQLAHVINGIIQLAAEDTAAYVALRDTVDGKPQAESSGTAQVQVAIAIDFIGNEK